MRPAATPSTSPCPRAGSPASPPVSTTGALPLAGLTASHIDYRTVHFTEVVHEVDVVLETVGGDYGERSLRSLRPGGLLVTVVERANAVLREKAEAAGRRFAGVTVEPDHTGLEALSALVDSGHLRPDVGHTLPLADAPKAHELIESGHVQGKIVLAV